MAPHCPAEPEVSKVGRHTTLGNSVYLDQQAEIGDDDGHAETDRGGLDAEARGVPDAGAGLSGPASGGAARVSSGGRHLPGGAEAEYADASGLGRGGTHRPVRAGGAGGETPDPAAVTGVNRRADPGVRVRAAHRRPAWPSSCFQRLRLNWLLDVLQSRSLDACRGRGTSCERTGASADVLTAMNSDTKWIVGTVVVLAGCCRRRSPACTPASTTCTPASTTCTPASTTCTPT